MFVLLLYRMIFTGDVTVTQSLPETASANSEFTVELTINKGNIDGAAKLQQELPQGFTAIAIENNGASFTFSNQILRLMWVSLPAESEFKVSYKIVVDKNVSGTKSFGGDFSYVEENTKKSVEISASEINITSERPQAANTANEEVKPSDAIQTQAISCKRELPSEVSKDFIVKIIIKKGGLSDFAKIEEMLPEGYTATAITTAGSAFTFIDRKVKFVWIALPKQEEFSVSYKVSITKDIEGTKQIEGVFSYLENNETRKSIITPSDVIVKSAEQITEAKDAKKTEAAKETEAVTKIPAPQTGVNYSVQIAAVHKPVATEFFVSKYKITDVIAIELHEGWTKYSVASLNEYKPARDHREVIRNSGIKGPFVIAHNDGKRITVQEALMITAQKWYK